MYKSTTHAVFSWIFCTELMKHFPCGIVFTIYILRQSLFLRPFYLKSFQNTKINICRHTAIAPCKGIHDSLGFWIPPCGFRIPGTGFRIPDSSSVDCGFQKGLDSKFFSVLMLFFAFRVRVRILLY